MLRGSRGKSQLGTMPHANTTHKFSLSTSHIFTVKEIKQPLSTNFIHNESILSVTTLKWTESLKLNVEIQNTPASTEKASPGPCYPAAQGIF